MSQQEFSREEIRRAVREALLEALPAPVAKSRVPKSPVSNGKLMKQLMESAKANCKTPVAVDLSSDRKINEFVGELAGCLQDENVAGLIRAGRLKFQSSAYTNQGRSVSPSVNSASNGRAKSADNSFSNGRVESGVLTESKVLAIAKHHSQIEVSKSVILTPLAKDRARRLKIQIVRQ